VPQQPTAAIAPSLDLGPQEDIVRERNGSGTSSEEWQVAASITAALIRRYASHLVGRVEAAFLQLRLHRASSSRTLRPTARNR